MSPLLEKKPTGSETIFGIIYIEEKKDEGKYKLFMKKKREKSASISRATLKEGQTEKEKKEKRYTTKSLILAQDER